MVDPCLDKERAILADKISPLLLGLGRLLSRRLEQALAETELGLTPTQARAVVKLHFHGPLSQQALATHIDVEPSTLVAVLDVMEREGLARREPNPHDRRAYLVRLLPKGEAYLPDLYALWEGVEDDLVATLRGAEKKELRALLERLVEHLLQEEKQCT